MSARTLVVIAVVVAIFSPAAKAGQGPRVSRLMHEKLDRTQKILEAVVTSDWASLETRSRELERLTQDPGWSVFNSPEYAQYSAAFIRAVQDLHTAAVQRDLENAPQAYAALTLKCVDCHRYLARARMGAREATRSPEKSNERGPGRGPGRGQ